jgi:uncharacterized membrane protein YhaH (DUF805 family)
MFTGDAFLDFVIGMSLILSYFICRFVGEGLAGRIGRKRFVIRQFVIIFALALFIPFATLSIAEIVKPYAIFALKIILPAIIIPTACFIAWFVVTTDIKRLHDMNLDAKWFFILYILVIAAVGVMALVSRGATELLITLGAAFVMLRLFFMVIPGTKDSNRFGYNHDKKYIF